MLSSESIKIKIVFTHLLLHSGLTLIKKPGIAHLKNMFQELISLTNFRVA